HLHAQIGAATSDAQLSFVARWSIDQIDEAGYPTITSAEAAADLGVPPATAEAASASVQSPDPTGVGARSSAECSASQAREADRYDPCMARSIDNLDLVARGEFSRIKRMCGVDDEDFADMSAESRGYDPKPGSRFGGGGAAAVVPAISIRAVPRKDGPPAWDIA
ncbi:hypothetical protein OY671_011269, partial [Metschnikowia pulcherrima]